MKQAGKQIGLSKQENRSTHWILPGGSTRKSRHTLIPWMTQPVIQDVYHILVNVGDNAGERLRHMTAGDCQHRGQCQ